MNTPIEPNPTLAELLKRLQLRGHASTVLVATSVIEESLARLIQARMTGLSKPLKDRLFNGYGPLSMIAARIDLARAFGFISEDDHIKLRLVNKIRVEIAHSRKLIDLHQLHDLMCKLAERTLVREENYLDVFLECVASISKKLDSNAAST